MALIFVDGFDHYATADILKKYTSTATSPAITAGAGRRAGGALVCTSNQNIVKSVNASASLVIGVAFNTSAGSTNARPMLSLWDAGAAQCELRVNPDLTLSVTRNGVALTGGTSVNALMAGAFNYIEWKVTIADAIAANSCKVRVNGEDWITVATGQDTKNTTNATANQVTIGPVGSIGGTWVIDDLYICDQTGATNNNFLGDCRVDTLLPNADGTYSQFTPSTGTSHYALVDEATPNTTDYNDGINVGDRDSYNFANLSALASQTVYGVQANAAVMKDDAGARSVGTMARSGTTNSDGASVALGTSQIYVSQVYEINPNGGVAWTEATVNAAEFGVKVTA